MLTTRPRRSTSAVSYTESEAVEVRSHLDELQLQLHDRDPASTSAALLHGTNKVGAFCSSILRHERSNRMRDAFRALDGFPLLLNLLRQIPALLEGLESSAANLNLTLDFFLAMLELLCTVLKDHWGNCKFFRTRVEKDGWKSLELILQDLVATLQHKFGDGQKIRRQVFGRLVACAIMDRSGCNVLLAPDQGPETSNVDWDRKAEGVKSPHEGIRRVLGANPRVAIPQFLWLMASVWVRDIESSQLLLGSHVAIVLRVIAEASPANLAAMHGTGILSQLLPLICGVKLESNVRSAVEDVSVLLLSNGVGHIDDAHLLYDKSSTSSPAAKMLLAALDHFNPPYIHFDLSVCGFSSLELPVLSRDFPPPSSVHGYTLSVWLQIVKFDPKTHTTIFGAFDQSQKCFVLVYIEKDTKNLILQTSVTLSRPSVRFKSFTFAADKWYHVVIVHRRPKATSSSRASLFVNGEFVEQVKAHFPSPPSAPDVKEGDENGSPQRRGAVQAFLGTPHDLATKHGSKAATSQWRFASACLLGDALSDDLIAVYTQLGPRYFGNYQDCLGSFQTYRASATLNLRNEALHPGSHGKNTNLFSQEKSDIVAAIRSKASALLPETRILLNFSPMMTFDENAKGCLTGTAFQRSLSRTSSRNLQNATRSGRMAVAINGAFPSISESLHHRSGMALLVGSPLLVVPQALDDAAWRMGGCTPIVLNLLETAQTHEDVLRALGILFQTIRNSWRNSEAMERENGFSVLAYLISSKLTDPNLSQAQATKNSKDGDGYKSSNLTYDVLSMVLDFVGFNAGRREDSIIINPLAYRVLLVDLDVWRYSTTAVQQLYYEQFETFMSGSKYHNFNATRLFRMRITRKWLEALRSEIFYPETLEAFLRAFRSLLAGIVSAETHRAIALYISYAVFKPSERTPLPRSAKSIKRKQTLPLNFGRSADRSSSTDPFVGARPQLLTLHQIGVQVLAMYVDILCQKETDNVKKFARTVTNRWLLHLLADEDPTVVCHAAKLLARVLVVNRRSYAQKFSEKTSGFTIMQYRLKRWWSHHVLWLACFAILFELDVASVDFAQPFSLASMLSAFNPSEVKVQQREILASICSMLQNGLKTIIRDQEDPDSPTQEQSENHGLGINSQGHSQSRSRSKSLYVQTGDKDLRIQAGRRGGGIEIIQTVTRFLADLHTNSPDFRDFAVTSTYTQEIISLLFPIVVSTDTVSPDTELNSRDSALNFNGSDVIIRSMSQTSQKAPPIVRTTSVESGPSPSSSRTQALKRGSSFVLVTAEESKHQPSSARLDPVASPKSKEAVSMHLSHSLVESMLEMIVAVFTDQVLSRKDFQGIGLFMKVPPGFQEHQAYFESFVLRNTLTNLGNTLKMNQTLLSEPRVLTNLQRFCSHLDEAVYEGWFIDGAEPVLDFLGGLLEHLQRPDISQLKSVRLCSEVIASMRMVVSRICLLRLSEPDQSKDESATVSFLQKLAYWQTVLFASDATQGTFLKLFSYLLYDKLVGSNLAVREYATNLWRTFLVHKHDEAAGVLNRIMSTDEMSILDGFDKILELDNNAFIAWVDDHRAELDAIFFGNFAPTWETFVNSENRHTQESYKARVSRRREKLRQWVKEGVARDDIIRKHEISSDLWRKNIYAAEHLKHQRSIQDTQDAQAFNEATWAGMQAQLDRPCGFLDKDLPQRWQLDLTESRSRMRMRLIPDRKAHLHKYYAKGAASKPPASKRLSINTRKSNAVQEVPLIASPTSQSLQIKESETPSRGQTPDATPKNGDIDDDYELVEVPGGDAFEDKNRKVMRSLQRNDQIEHVYNVSRIVGLEACEGLLIIGKNALYLIDDFFQRSDGEIVDVWQAPPDERDAYMQMISGRKATKEEKPPSANRETRSWRWDEVLSISKRRFLFREVGIEVFFLDGRSYLLAFSVPKFRNDIYQKLLYKVPNIGSGDVVNSQEHRWRIEALRTPEDGPQSFGSRFTSVFAQGIASPATKKWIRGELSNFGYLMHINTMAGRTFNDLTQYPVFPWVLADYTSEELDLTNPRTFRDLTKPMGCQTTERQMEFRERYQTFAEMGDESAPPFHYGTHYSSAMIVTSYLIRLEPFVQSYLLLQGGSFDHADRLFYSIEKAWRSASRENMTDVRELVPEFYYLPEMFVNMNNFDFGLRQGTAGRIDNVALPPWAKGDPNIFVTKHREALESDYVSKHLHQWIDLIFGHKQRGEAALEATNIFHHLSYHGAKNPDQIEDPVERMATIGIIHNFGQTPHQVFHRSHPAREDPKSWPKKLDTLASTLTKLPFPLLESQGRITSLTFSEKTERLLTSGPLRLHMPPNYDIHVEWGMVDGSVRFFATESGKFLALFEHVHSTYISTAAFADGPTLITAGEDGVITIWAVAGAPKHLDIFQTGSLFGHSAPVTRLALSPAFRTLASADADGTVLVWDLNRRDLVRALVRADRRPVDALRINNATGVVAVCRGPLAQLYTLNGTLLLEQHVCVEGDESVTCAAWYEGAGAEAVERSLLFTGHRRGAVNVWALTVHDGRWMLEHVKRMMHTDAGGVVHGAAITCVLPMALTVYTGDEDGRVVGVGCPCRLYALTRDVCSISGTVFKDKTDVDLFLHSILDYPYSPEVWQ